jgi:hypothetical protein
MAGEQLGEEFLQSTRSINEKLAAQGYLDEQTASQIDNFRTIRNALVHGDNYLLTPETLEALRSLSGRLRWQWETSKPGAPAARVEAKPSSAMFSAMPGTKGIERAWFHVMDSNGHGYILAMVNAKGSCSMRTFDADDGKFLGKRYQQGNYQQSFSTYLEKARELKISKQPNLENECRVALPGRVLTELHQQMLKERGELIQHRTQ